MSRIAVLSDIHGNLPALEAVIADAEARGCTGFLNLGDSLSGPLWPADTADFLIARDWPTIAGNHERQVMSGGTMGASDAFTAARLTDRHLAWIAALPPMLAHGDIVLCHGTPASDVDHLLYSVDIDGLRSATDVEIAARVGTVPGKILLCGHTHLPCVRTISGRTIANPGSAGLQAYADDRPFAYAVRNGDPRARYAIVEHDGVSLLAVDYDHRAAASKAAGEGFDDWAIWLATGSVSA